MFYGCYGDEACLFSNSKLNFLLHSHKIPQCPHKIIDTEDSIPAFILGYSAYPLLLYLMKEHANGGFSSKEQYFWVQTCSARNVIDCSLGQRKLEG